MKEYFEILKITCDSYYIIMNSQHIKNSRCNICRLHGSEDLGSGVNHTGHNGQEKTYPKKVFRKIFHLLHRKNDSN